MEEMITLTYVIEPEGPSALARLLPKRDTGYYTQRERHVAPFDSRFDAPAVRGRSREPRWSEPDFARREPVEPRVPSRSSRPSVSLAKNEASVRPPAVVDPLPPPRRRSPTRDWNEPPVEPIARRRTLLPEPPAPRYAASRTVAPSIARTYDHEPIRMIRPASTTAETPRPQRESTYYQRTAESTRPVRLVSQIDPEPVRVARPAVVARTPAAPRTRPLARPAAPPTNPCSTAALQPAPYCVPQPPPCQPVVWVPVLCVVPAETICYW